MEEIIAKGLFALIGVIFIINIIFSFRGKSGNAKLDAKIDGKLEPLRNLQGDELPRYSWFR